MHANAERVDSLN